MKINREVPLQLAKEFWFPAVVAGVWTLAGIADQGGLTITAAVTRASASFFFVSWLTGQIFRVAKQTRTERSFVNIQTRLEGILADIKAETRRLETLFTGGDSFAYIIFSGIETGSPTALAVHQGHAPVYDLAIRVLNLRSFDMIQGALSLESIRSCEAHFNVSNMTPGYASQLGQVENYDGSARDFNVFFTARNGGWVQLYRARKIEGRWVTATLVQRQDVKPQRTEVVLATKDDDFPTEFLPSNWPAAGEIPPTI